MKVVVVGEEGIGYAVPDRLFKRFEKARDKANKDGRQGDLISSPHYDEYQALRQQIVACQAFVVDMILTGDE